MFAGHVAYAEAEAFKVLFAGMVEKRSHKPCEKKRFAGKEEKVYLCILIIKIRKEDGRDT